MTKPTCPRWRAERAALGPYSIRTVVRTVDGAQHLAHPADVAPLSVRARGATA